MSIGGISAGPGSASVPLPKFQADRTVGAVSNFNAALVAAAAPSVAARPAPLRSADASLPARQGAVWSLGVGAVESQIPGKVMPAMGADADGDPFRLRSFGIELELSEGVDPAGQPANLGAKSGSAAQIGAEQLRIRNGHGEAEFAMYPGELVYKREKKEAGRLASRRRQPKRVSKRGRWPENRFRGIRKCANRVRDRNVHAPNRNRQSSWRAVSKADDTDARVHNTQRRS